MLKTYLKNIAEITGMGDAREESYYPALAKLLGEYAKNAGKSGIHVTSLPKQTEAGNPDFRVWDGKQHIVGYIEAKTPTIENLDKIEQTDQLRRYLHTFPNVILTNFFEFSLYRNGELTDKVLIARPFIAHTLKTIPPVEKQTDFINLLEKFFLFSIPKVYSAKTLAVELAKRTRFLRDEVVTEELRETKESGKAHIHGFYEAFRQYLISALTKEEFADLYAQTVTYGLFAARTRTEKGFSRKTAYDSIPHTIGILRDVFRFISLGDLPQEMEWIIDDIAEVLEVTDVKNILRQYFHDGKGSDPIVHFYETFLAEYDPAMREKRGVYYTPEPVVSYIVRSLHAILKERFGETDGLADASVTVLDPAGGTLTFLAEAAKLAVEEFTSKYGSGAKANFIRDHILKNFYAFKLMMAPYAIGHLKMSFLLEELGHKLAKDERFKLYLTNTLEMEDLPESQLPGTASLSEESHLAGRVKKEQPILVILGNPPYSVSSTNKSDFVEREMELYKTGVKDEKNIQPLSDDYIKFIRFAHWKIDKAGKGVVGIITNNSYLSGLIHRGMRDELLKSFNDIYILNLHGNSRIGEKTPEGSKDENVFDIQQGVAIALFLKDKTKKSPGNLFYYDVYGLREEKYEYLKNHDLKSTGWQELGPVLPYCFFVKKDFSLQSVYDQFVPVQNVFVQYSSGVKTHRDHFVIDFSKKEIKQKIGVFVGDLPDELVEQALHLKDTDSFKMTDARKALRETNWEESILSYAYRPFDDRFICYKPELIDRDRYDVMQHFFENNLGLQLKRSRYIKVFDFKHAFVVSNISNINYFGDQNVELSSLFV